MSTQLSH
nr:unnamed protein product [Callosobruchus analis]